MTRSAMYKRVPEHRKHWRNEELGKKDRPWTGSAGVVDYHGLTLDRDQPLLLKRFQYSADHLSRAADNSANLLPRDLDLHPIGMSHGVGFLAHINQCARHATGHIQESKVTNLLGRLAQTFGHLAAKLEQYFRVLVG